MPAWLKKADRALTELLWPTGAVCLICGRLSGGEALCGDCREELDRGWLEHERGPVQACWTHKGPAGTLVRLLKDRGVEQAAEVLAEGLARRAREAGLPPDAVVTWVPMPRHRRLQRGRDHGKTLAEAAAARLGLAVVPLLRRRKHSSRHTQRGLNREMRRKNVAGAFEPAAAELPPRVLLVADVRTTGATLHACGEALRRAGARQVWALTATAAAADRSRREEHGGEAAQHRDSGEE